MQKISTYLYPNRIDIISSNEDPLPVEWRIVYQRNIKIYKGVHNRLTLDVKNADQKRLDIESRDLKFVLLDLLGQEIYTATAESIESKGLAIVTIPDAELAALPPQFLKFSIYEVVDGQKYVLYGDTQFGAQGHIELLDTILPTTVAPKIIDRFLAIQDPDYTINRKTFTSEAVEATSGNIVTDTISIRLDFDFLSLVADVTVQFTEDAIVNHSTDWRDVETFSVDASTVGLSKIYSGADYSNNVNWVRIKYLRDKDNTGSIDKVIVRV
jgi:hypothetical protein